MPKDIHQRDTAQQRSSRLLLAMGIIVLLGALAYFVLTLVVNRRTPASPDTRYTAENGISVYYESAVRPVCEMTEDATLWPCVGTGLCPEQRRRQLSGRALPERHERHL